MVAARKRRCPFYRRLLSRDHRERLHAPSGVYITSTVQQPPEVSAEDRLGVRLADPDAT